MTKNKNHSLCFGLAGCVLACVLAGACATPACADTWFLSDSYNVTQYDTAGNSIQQLALPVDPGIGNTLGGFVSPTGLAVGADGSLYVADYQLNTGSLDGVVYHFSSSGSYLGIFKTDSSLSEPQGMAFDGSGNLYVTNYNYNNPYVSIYDSTGTEVLPEFGSGPLNGLGLGAPAGGVAFGPNGHFYVPDPYNGIDEYLADGTFVQSFGFPSPVSNPGAVAVDSSGNIWVADVNGQIVEFDSTGTEIMAFTAGWAQPAALAFNSSGQLYVLDDNGFSPFDPAGPTPLNVSAQGLFLAYSATPAGVPEPATLAMCGIGLLGLLLLRRRVQR